MKFQNSSKIQQKFIKTNPLKEIKNILSIERKNLGLGQIFWQKD
jgi:hypothetical protein